MLFLNYRIFYSRIVQNSLLFGRFTFYLYFCKFFMTRDANGNNISIDVTFCHMKLLL